MFTTRSESADVDPQSRYGEPQHEEERWNEWESEYYGNGDQQDTLVDIEFVTEIEYRIEDESASLPAGRRTQPLSAGD
ncbi:hypothetical protein HAPAU_09280 [Halalkalicoccus paucihalophilus]|jgi:hypothetical protein|uniref:Uncharacterized protein n=1 Tax=Halalkalicoccus paucihalophilus TaxID=1008153 RepID=A0A151AHB4_9EURY|nr:hypothetical protein [Halalkalicoccus paucihalophilus]KYH27038.1 hypothetical protein HAPAU_09280 [Halalkalicoccus paucihalophilus]